MIPATDETRQAQLEAGELKPDHHPHPDHHGEHHERIGNIRARQHEQSPPDGKSMLELHYRVNRAVRF
jgi:hypothetical protein